MPTGLTRARADPAWHYEPGYTHCRTSAPDGDRAAAALGLALPAEGDVLARLREVALGIGKDFVLIFTSEGEPCDPLFEG
jgi:hypothetical protein